LNTSTSKLIDTTQLISDHLTCLSPAQSNS
jgi:hypothetical protein